MIYRRKEKLYFLIQGLIERRRTHGAPLTCSWETKMHTNTKNKSLNESTVENAGNNITKLFKLTDKCRPSSRGDYKIIKKKLDRSIKKENTIQ